MSFFRNQLSGQAIESKPCPLCGSHRQEIVWTHKKGTSNGICLSCGHIYLMRSAIQDTEETGYQGYQQCYPESYLKNEKNAFYELALRRQSLLKKSLAIMPSSILEIGCGYGHFLSLWDKDFFCAGIEPSNKQASFARDQLGLGNIWEGPYESLTEVPPGWPAKGFDLICCFHVLEHVAEPDKLLKFIRRMLVPGGCLCIAVPNIHTLSPDLIELYFLCHNWHLHTFSPDCLSWLVIRQGFEIIIKKEEEPTPMLRSSFLIIARSRHDSMPKASPPSESSITNSYRALWNFHNSIEEGLERIKKSFHRWESLGKHVAIYGGGMHTRALLELSGISPNQVGIIIDDDHDKQGKTLDGIIIQNFQVAMQTGVEVIVVSSLASEDALLERLKKILPAKVELIGIYRDLMQVSRVPQKLL